MQCNGKDSLSNASISDRNSFHGDGSESTGILEMLRPQIRQQIPMHCFSRSVLRKPSPLALRPWRSVKNIFFYQAAVIELGPEFTKRLYSGVFVIRDSFSY